MIFLKNTATLPEIFNMILSHALPHVSPNHIKRITVIVLNSTGTSITYKVEKDNEGFTLL